MQSSELILPQGPLMQENDHILPRKSLLEDEIPTYTGWMEVQFQYQRKKKQQKIPKSPNQKMTLQDPIHSTQEVLSRWSPPARHRNQA